MSRDINHIFSLQKNYRKSFQLVLKKITSYEHIAIFRHIRPDYDAYGAQVGLALWIKENFPKKDVKMMGDDHQLYSKKLYPLMDKVKEDWFKKPFLGIIVDAANISRIADPRYKKADYLIKIDHHPNNEPFGDLMIVNSGLVSVAELIANMLLSFKPKYKLSEEVAKYLYTGIVGDSGRFKYDLTSPHTFEISGKLLETGFNLPLVTQDIYSKPLSDLEISKFILDHYVLTNKGVCYYVMENKDLERFHIEVARAKDFLQIFANIEEVKIFLSITEDITEHIYRVSLRSKLIPINGVAEKYGGGGHHLASGAKIKNKTEIKKLISDLEALIK